MLGIHLQLFLKIHLLFGSLCLDCYKCELVCVFNWLRWVNNICGCVAMLFSPCGIGPFQHHCVMAWVCGHIFLEWSRLYKNWNKWNSYAKLTYWYAHTHTHTHCTSKCSSWSAGTAVRAILLGHDGYQCVKFLIAKFIILGLMWMGGGVGEFSGNGNLSTHTLS